MKLKTISACLLGLLLACQTTLAESPQVERNVGKDGIPVITIKSDKAPPAPKATTKPTEIPQRKAFRVYELEGDPAPKTETKVVVLSSPPPIAPNYNYYPYPWFGPGYGPGFGPGFGPTPFFYGGFGNFYGYGSFLNYQNPPVNYQNPPVNYQNPPVNYQNPPANYRPIPRAYYPGRCR